MKAVGAFLRKLGITWPVSRVSSKHAPTAKGQCRCSISTAESRLKAAVSVFTSVLNILSFGSITKLRDPGVHRFKAMGHSVLSILATPLSMGVEVLSSVSHLISPTEQKIDRVATTLWTGGYARFTSEKEETSD